MRCEWKTKCNNLTLLKTYLRKTKCDLYFPHTYLNVTQIQLEQWINSFKTVTIASCQVKCSSLRTLLSFFHLQHIWPFQLRRISIRSVARTLRVYRLDSCSKESAPDTTKVCRAIVYNHRWRIAIMKCCGSVSCFHYIYSITTEDTCAF